MQLIPKLQIRKSKILNLISEMMYKFSKKSCCSNSKKPQKRKKLKPRLRFALTVKV